MGQSFNKLTAGSEGAKKKEDIVKDCYEKHFKDKEISNMSDFYQAICSAVEKLNVDRGYTQVKVIDKKMLLDKHKTHCKECKPTYEEFKKIVGDLEKNFELTGVGVKDTLLYIFGVPASATFIKNAIMPGLVSNEVLIPSMTSLTVLVLAKLNKI